MTKEQDVRDEKADSNQEKNEQSASKLYSAARLLVWMCVILGVLLTGNLIRSYFVQSEFEQFQSSAERTEEAANRTAETAEGAKESADAALTELRNAIEVVESTAGDSELTDEAILLALEAIARMEAYLCGGHCPSP